MPVATRALRGLLLLLLLPVSVAHAADVFSFSSTSGDYIGQGQTQVYTSANSTITVQGNGQDIRISVQGGGHWWDIDLGAPSGSRFAPGRYFNAERSAFRTGRSVGLDMGGDGRGCNQVWGDVNIRQIAYDPAGNVIALEASFIQRCESATAPPLAGVIFYRAAQYSFRLDGDEYVAGGTHKSYFGDTSLVTLSGTTAGIQIGVSGQRDDWMALISPPKGQLLKAGTYSTLRFADATHAGLDFFGNGRGCNMSSGVLKVTRVVAAPNGDVLRFAAVFQQSCDGGPVLLQGDFHYGT